MEDTAVPWVRMPIDIVSPNIKVYLPGKIFFR
jgi:hypothetical protein